MSLTARRGRQLERGEVQRQIERSFLVWMLAACGAAALSARLALAQTTPAPDDAQPPELLESVEASYPEPAKSERLEASVLLRITIDASGSVLEAEVVEPVGHGFDEAAQQAALRFRFKPAQRGGQPVAARVSIRYDFKLPPEPAPEPTPEPESEPEPASASESSVAPMPASDAGASPPPVRAAQPVVEVRVHGAPSEAQRLQRSAEAVTVIDTAKAKRQAADLAEVLARTQGVSIRREGGLGSSMRFSLNGLEDEQVRFFLDGVPFDVAGYPFGIENVPVNLVSRVEVYRGVVPIRFGADALGGAVNLVSDTSYETHAGASYQVGSFDTHRVTVNGRYRNEPTGIVLGTEAFFDTAENDYEVDVESADALGQTFAVTVPRFHDAYRARGVRLETGVVDRPWAERLLVRAFYSGYDKEQQHNPVMTTPYGEVEDSETVYGVTGRYLVELHRGFDLDVVVGYAHRLINHVDKSAWVYDWFGDRIDDRDPAGEIEGEPHDQLTGRHSAFGRAGAAWQFLPQHALRATVTTTFGSGRGDERIQADPDAIDLETSLRQALTLVSGLEYEANLFDDRLSNVVFVKDYYYRATSEEPASGGALRNREKTRHFPGVGDGLRFLLTPWLYAKASYEYGTRLPSMDETFGNGADVRPNPELEPENSHNANLGPRVELTRTRFGDLVIDANAFWRESKQLIVQFGSDRSYTNVNLYGARSRGLEGALEWSSPGRYVSLNGTATWQDHRNTATQGNYAKYEGDRLPNRPYLFGSWGANLHFGRFLDARDSIDAFYNGRYVHWFYRGWESVGRRFYKITVDSQVTQSAGVTWSAARDFGRYALTLEIDNVTDAKVFDNYGVQRPGRAFYLKATGDI
jgi:TonB family protein